ncbi:MAG: diguanylate cyclase [Candidatus Omnitrophota bacterium]
MSKNKKILLVVEDLNLERILTYLLKAWSYEVIPCSNEKDALRLSSQKHPDLIIIDAHLNTINGLKLCKILKDDFITAYIPIIILIEKKQLRRNLLEIEQGVDDFLIKPPDPIDLEIRIALSLRSADHQFHANALTKLPGNKSIEKLINTYLKEGKIFSSLYLDINKFKSFNDKYGYLAGDKAILQTAKIISSAVKRLGNPSDFVGHIGGDDFICLTTPDKEELIAKECINEFDRLIPLHYSPQDKENGFIKTKNRNGHLTQVPIMGLSAAIVNNQTTSIHSIFELIEITFEIKEFLKKHHASNYLINRRTTDAGPDQRFSLNQEYSHELKRHHHHLKIFKPLGQIMIETRLLNEKQLEEALNYHWNTGEQLGEAVISLGFSDLEHIRQLLKHQPSFHSQKDT